MIRVITADNNLEYLCLEEIRQKGLGMDENVENQVKEIIETVKSDKDAAVKMYSKRFDGVDEIKILDKTDFENAYNRCSSALKSALTEAAQNINEYHRLQIQKGFTMTRNGCVLGQMVRGLERVGIYVPGGRAAYPSTVLMNAIPAKIANVGQVIIFSPPINGAADNILAAAHVAKADKLILVGGAHAIAAAAYGTQTIPRVDKIVGPGNIFVATAKRLVYGACDIDMVAGPSEITIIADQNANPDFVAADLMSQAEHDPMASSILLTNSQKLVDNTLNSLARQINDRTRKDTIIESLSNNGLIILCQNMRQMLDISNQIAPEHLELLIDNPFEVLDNIKNAGSVFLGAYSPEPLGDYLAGTNHVLPTGGTARFYSPLSVDSFVKKIQFISYTKDELLKVSDKLQCIAECEGFDAHINSVNIRKVK